MAATGQLVLVVDDDDSMREAIARLLGVAGFERATYVTAEAMLADVGRHAAACVVCDVRLPGMSGFDLLAGLRAQGGAPPVILITAHDAPGLKEEAMRRGASAYLAKPFLGTTLLEAVRTVIEAATQSKR